MHLSILPSAFNALFHSISSRWASSASRVNRTVWPLAAFERRFRCRAFIMAVTRTLDIHDKSPVIYLLWLSMICTYRRFPMKCRPTPRLWLDWLKRKSNVNGIDRNACQTHRTARAELCAAKKCRVSPHTAILSNNDLLQSGEKARPSVFALCHKNMCGYPNCDGKPFLWSIAAVSVCAAVASVRCQRSEMLFGAEHRKRDKFTCGLRENFEYIEYQSSIWHIHHSILHTLV